LDYDVFINLIVLVEKKYQDEFGVSISLTDDLWTEEDNALKTVGSFIDYLCRVVKEEVSNGKATGQI
jgi:acyl carrier protein